MSSLFSTRKIRYDVPPYWEERETDGCQAIIHNEKNVLMHVFDQSTIEVIDERYRARKASTRDWEAFVRLIGPWSQLTVKQREAVEDEVFERCEWLQKAEGELAEESVSILLRL